MSSGKGAERKAPPVKREPNRDGKTSSTNKTAKETEGKTKKVTKSVYSVLSKQPSKARDTSVSKVKQDGGDARLSKDGVSKKQQPTEKLEKAASSRRQETSSVRESVIKSKSLDVGRSRDPKVASLPSRPVIKSKPAGSTSQQKPQPAKNTTSSKDTPVKPKINLTTRNDKKTPSLPSKAPVSITHASRTNRQPTTQKSSVTKPSHTSQKKHEKDKLSSTRAKKNLDTEAAVPVPEKSKDASKSGQGGERESEISVSRLDRARTRTRTLSPEEVKVLRNIVAKNLEHRKRRDSSSRGTPPDQSSPKQAAERELDEAAGEGVKMNSNENDDEYADDFEDYESDFEEATDSELGASTSVGGTSDNASSVSDEDESSGGDSTDVEVVEMTSRQHHLPVEEEKKLDSGNYDLAEKRRKGRELEDIKVAMERENSAATENRKTACQDSVMEPVPADEGFVEEKSEDLNSSLTIVSNTNFVNFANARKRQLEKKVIAKVKKRGEELLGMVTLDVVGFSLLDLAPIPYEIYMKSYGRSNTMQVYVQTNEDSISEEVQTDEIHVKNKWTQKPVSFCTKLQSGDGKTGEFPTFSQDHLGVGSDEADEELHAWKNRITFNSIRLNQFLASAGQAVLILLEEGQRHDGSLLRPSPGDMAFSEGFTALDVESVPFLAGRPVTCVCFPHTPTNLLLTVHKSLIRQVGDGDGGKDDASLGRSMVCVWNSLEPSRPQKVLVASGEVCAACFDLAKASLVFGGLADGSVCVWDLEEQSLHHKVVRVGTFDWTIRSPTYTTAEILKSEGHLGPVVSLQPVIEAENKEEGSTAGSLSPVQVCSLGETGLLLVWTVVRSRKPAESSGASGLDLGLAPWGQVRLLRSSSIHLGNTLGPEETLQCCDLALDRQRSDHVYVATISGHVAHCLRSGARPRPPAYLSTWGGLSSARCLEPCPFSQPFFLVGCMEGIVRLHSQASEKPLLTLAATGDALGQGPPITAVQWSKSDPFVFFVLDGLSRLHVWNLSTSDMCPQFTINLADKAVTTIRLSSHAVGRKNPPQLVLASSCGKVEIHQLKEELACGSDDEVAGKVKKFLYYTSLL